MGTDCLGIIVMTGFYSGLGGIKKSCISFLLLLLQITINLTALNNKFIPLQFWKPKFQNQFYWTEVNVLAGMVPSGGCEERVCFLSFFSELVVPVCLCFWPLPSFSMHVALVSVCIVIPPFPLTVPAPSYKDGCSYISSPPKSKSISSAQNP